MPDAPAEPLYFDFAATSAPKPAAVVEAVAQALRSELGNPGRGAHAAAGRSADLLARTRLAIARAQGGSEPRRVVLTSGATQALNIAILGLALGREPVVWASTLEHNAVDRPLASLGVPIHRLPCDEAGALDPDTVVAAAGDADIIAINAASNVTGLRQPVNAICRALADHPAIVVADACQVAGHADATEPDFGWHLADCVALSAHKAYLGPTGIGALLLSARVYDEAGDAGAQPMQPTAFGGTGSGSAEMPTALPTRFEPGTPPVHAAAGFLAALDRPGRRPTPALDQIIAGTSGLPIRWLPRGAGPTVPVASFVCTDGAWHAADIAAALDASFAIRVRAGLHCAPNAHRHLGTFDTGGAVRVSPGPGATAMQADRFVRALHELLG